MELTKKQLDLLKRRKIVVLATSSASVQPRAIFVEINQVRDDKVIITDNEMETTKKNLLENKNVFVLVFEEDCHYGLKILGEAEYRTEGEYFDFVKNLESNRDYDPKGVLIITIKDVVEFE